MIFEYIARSVFVLGCLPFLWLSGGWLVVAWMWARWNRECERRGE